MERKGNTTFCNGELRASKKRVVYDILSRRGIELTEKTKVVLENYRFTEDTVISETSKGVEIMRVLRHTMSEVIIKADGTYAFCFTVGAFF